MIIIIIINKTKKGKTKNVCFIQGSNTFACKNGNLARYETCRCYGRLVKVAPSLIQAHLAVTKFSS